MVRARRRRICRFPAASYIVMGTGPNSTAARAGVRVGSVIPSIKGHDLVDLTELRFRVATLAIGTTGRLVLWRNRRHSTVTVMLAVPPGTLPRQITTAADTTSLAGPTFANLNPAWAEELGLDTILHGATITDIKERPIADRFGLRSGGIVVSLNRQPMEKVNQLRTAFSNTSSPWIFGKRRGGKLFAVGIR